VRIISKPNTASILGEEVEVVEDYRVFTWTADWSGNATLRLPTRRDGADCTC